MDVVMLCELTELDEATKSTSVLLMLDVRFTTGKNKALDCSALAKLAVYCHCAAL